MKKLLSKANYIVSTVYGQILAKLLLKITILTPIETAEEILKYKKSLVRFGDGELEWMNENHVANFQRGSKQLALALKRTLQRDDGGLLVGIPNALLSTKNLTSHEKEWWRKWSARHILHFFKLIHGRQFASTFFSRPYIMYRDSDNADQVFKTMKQIFKNRNIVIVEGNLTRFGMGNDLLASAKTVRRIIGPSTNAFEKRTQIEMFIEENISIEEDVLFLVALGPAATVIAADLFDKGFQAIDIGHADLEYEWYIQKAVEKLDLPFKGVNEVADGYQVNQLPVNLRTEYVNEIIGVID